MRVLGGLLPLQSFLVVAEGYHEFRKVEKTVSVDVIVRQEVVDETFLRLEFIFQKYIALQCSLFQILTEKG